MTRMPQAPAPRDARPPHGIVPPWLLRRIAEAADHYDIAADAARRSLVRDRPLRDLRVEGAIPPFVAHERERAEWPTLHPHAEVDAAEGAEAGIHVEAPGDASPERRISDAEQFETLPGRLVRREGQPETGDTAVDQAYDGLGEVFRLFHRVYGRDAIDGGGGSLEATVHFGDHYDNAFWDGERMVFGDGDGEVFRGFTHSLSVVGHELAHGVTEATARLRYRDQSGALNEHVSDVFGALVEQYAMGQDAAAASWLIGEGVFTELVQGSALRSMIQPGTAYDDDVLGRDPQPAHMRDFVRTDDDNGGVHLNSGIPNRAFALAATELGGFAWEHVGRIWYDTLTGGVLKPNAGFDAFVAATLDATKARFGPTSAEVRAVAGGWSAVGLDAE